MDSVERPRKRDFDAANARDPTLSTRHTHAFIVSSIISFSDSTSVIDTMTSLPESDSRDQNEDSRKQMDHDADEDRNTVEETERAGEDGQHSDEAGRGSSSTATSVFQNFTVLRDFFFAAFSDGYNVCTKRERNNLKRSFVFTLISDLFAICPPRQHFAG